MKEVARIINHPQVYNMISDDLSQPPYVPRPYEFYVINEEKTGVIRIDPMNGIMCQVHTSCMPELWGHAKDFVAEAIAWGWENTRYSKIISFVPDFNPLAARLCQMCGFKKEGVIKKSFLKNFKLYDQTIYGLSKYENKGE